MARRRRPSPRSAPRSVRALAQARRRTSRGIAKAARRLAPLAGWRHLARPGRSGWRHGRASALGVLRLLLPRPPLAAAAAAVVPVLLASLLLSAVSVASL